MTRERADAVIVGGGFYGLTLALHLHTRAGLGRVVVLEERADCLRRASYVNQARVHQGYHYPRSLLTASRSRESYPRFCAEFADAIDATFEKYYAIARRSSKVTAQQFAAFCARIGAPLREAPRDVTALVNPDLIEAVFTTEESAFDADGLRDHQLRRIAATNGAIEVRTGVRVERVEAGDGVSLVTSAGPISAPLVLNCTYAGINDLNRRSGLAPLPLKFEMTEMVLVNPVGLPRPLGLTVMDGPFFSLMPFPARHTYSLSHVRYTPHSAWLDEAASPGCEPRADGLPGLAGTRTSFGQMRADVARFLPRVALEYQDSIWDIKTVLRRAEGDDARPILFASDLGLDGYLCIMGGKIDNVYDAEDELDALIAARTKEEG